MKYLYTNKHWSINKDYNIDKILYLMIDRPNEIEFGEDFIWSNNNNKRQYHRDYGFPAIVEIYDKGCYYLYWRENGKIHREKSKPAIISYTGNKQYYINDKFIKEEWPE